MQLSVIAIGKKMPGWVEQGVHEYTRRLPRAWQFSCKEIPQAKAGTAAVNTSREADALLSALPERAHVVALDNRGANWDTKELSLQLGNWQEVGKPVCLLIGGQDGLHSNCIERSNQMWSLSALTFPHPLVRVIVAEQLYRAHSLLTNHPYHRA